MSPSSNSVKRLVWSSTRSVTFVVRGCCKNSVRFALLLCINRNRFGVHTARSFTNSPQLDDDGYTLPGKSRDGLRHLTSREV